MDEHLADQVQLSTPCPTSKMILKRCRMSAMISGFTLPNIFGFGAAPANDGFWDEPSTLKTTLTAEASLMEDNTCNHITSSTLANLNHMPHCHSKKLQLHYAAPSA